MGNCNFSHAFDGGRGQAWNSQPKVGLYIYTHSDCTLHSTIQRCILVERIMARDGRKATFLAAYSTGLEANFSWTQKSVWCFAVREPSRFG